MPDQAMFNRIPDERPIISPFLPALHPQNHQNDEIFSVNVPPTLVRYINETSWRGFNTLLPAGTRILIRNSHVARHNICYHLVATQNSFRRLIYIYAMDEIGPEHDMTAEEYFQQHPYVAPNAVAPIAALPDYLINQSWANAVASSM